MRHIIVYRGRDGYWIAECPSLPGCATQGKTVEEAIKNAKEAVRAYIKALKKAGEPVPPETSGLLVAEV